MQRGRALVGLGVTIGAFVVGCGGEEPGPGSKVEQESAGAGGMAGAAGGLALPSLSGAGSGGGGAGGGGNGGAGGGGASAGGGAPQAGSAAGGDTSSAGKSGGGTGGSSPAGTCKRVPASDADCAEFWEDDKTQAYACDDGAAYSALNGMHAGACGSLTGIPGGNRGACCPP
jgi:hypothetical protein